MLRDLALAEARLGNEGAAALATAERFTLEGAFRDAERNAARAAALLPEGSPGWRRAEDIITMTRRALKRRTPCDLSPHLPRRCPPGGGRRPARRRAGDADARAAMSSPFSEGERAALHAEIRAYLLANPEVLTEMIQLLEQKQQAATAENDRDLVAMHAKDIFDDGFSWVGGNPDGQFTVVEFLDYQCGYCRRAQPDVTELVGSDGDIRLIVKEMPILGPGSELAARAAVATLITEGPETYARAARPADGACRARSPT